MLVQTSTPRLGCLEVSWDDLQISGFDPEKYVHLDFKNAVTHLGKYNSFKASIKLKNEIFKFAMKNYSRIPFAGDSTGHLSSNYWGWEKVICKLRIFIEKTESIFKHLTSRENSSLRSHIWHFWKDFHRVSEKQHRLKTKNDMTDGTSTSGGTLKLWS